MTRVQFPKKGLCISEHDSKICGLFFFCLCPSAVPDEDTEEMSLALFWTSKSKVWRFGEPEKKLMCLGFCCKSPVNVKQLQFSIGLSIPEN